MNYTKAILENRSQFLIETVKESSFVHFSTASVKVQGLIYRNTTEVLPTNGGIGELTK